MFRQVCKVFFGVGIVTLVAGFALAFPVTALRAVESQAPPTYAQTLTPRPPLAPAQPLTPRPPLTPTVSATATPTPQQPAPETTATPALPVLLPETGNTGAGHAIAWVFPLLGLLSLAIVCWGLHLRRRSL